MQGAAESVEHRIIVPRLAIGYFAGLRAAEIDKLTWQDVKFDAGIIAVSERIAKNHIPRPVKISPNLRQWLEPYKGKTGSISLGYAAFRIHVREVMKKAGVPWVPNAMRHTFATHHYAFYQSADLTAKELGHMGSYRLLHRNYANSGITKSEAAGYWAITPAGISVEPVSLIVTDRDTVVTTGSKQENDKEAENVA